MRTLEAKFKIVTPMFISGADQTEAELRVPSIKGMLRFWWRAVNYIKDNKELLEKESQIFGSSNDKIGQSKVQIQLIDAKTKDKKDKKIASKWKVSDWKSYVGYGLSEDLREKDGKKGDKKNELHRSYLEESVEFTIQCISKTESALNELVPAIKMFGLLGGLGSRSRKGWGSVAISDFKYDNSNSWKVPQTREEYIHELKSIIEGIQVEEQPVYSAFSKKTEIRVGKSYPTYEGAFKEIATKYKDYIKGLKDKKNREDFGLPRKEISEERRASPVMLHIHQAGNEFFWVCVFMNSKFLPSRNATDNYKAVLEFMNYIGGEKL